MYLSNHVFACVVDQQMYMVGRDDVVEDTKSNALFRFKKPVEITAPIARKRYKLRSSPILVGKISVSAGSDQAGTRFALTLNIVF